MLCDDGNDVDANADDSDVDDDNSNIYKVVMKKLHHVLCTIILQSFAVESRGFHQNAQKLTGNTNNGRILTVVIKYSLSGNTNGKGTT